MAGAALGLDAFWLEPASLHTVERTIHIDRADSANLKGLRIAVIADLHAGSPFIDAAKIDEVVRQTMAAKPNLILLAGDYVIDGVIGGHYMPIDAIAPRLKPLHAPLAFMRCWGNHDHWGDPYRTIAAFRRAGIPVSSIRVCLSSAIAACCGSQVSTISIPAHQMPPPRCATRRTGHCASPIRRTCFRCCRPAAFSPSPPIPMADRSSCRSWVVWSCPRIMASVYAPGWRTRPRAISMSAPASAPACCP